MKHKFKKLLAILVFLTITLFVGITLVAPSIKMYNEHGLLIAAGSFALTITLMVLIVVGIAWSINTMFSNDFDKEDHDA